MRIATDDEKTKLDAHYTEAMSPILTNLTQNRGVWHHISLNEYSSGTMVEQMRALIAEGSEHGYHGLVLMVVIKGHRDGGFFAMLR